MTTTFEADTISTSAEVKAAAALIDPSISDISATNELNRFKADPLKGILHQSPRRFGKARSTWISSSRARSSTS